MQQIAVQILNDTYSPGHVFPGEIEFSEQLGISRSALRETFRTLMAKGLVESRPKAGTRVLGRDRWSLLDPDVLAWQFEAGPSEKFFKDLFELRSVVEPPAAAIAAVRRTPEHITAMCKALEDMERHGLATEVGREADQRFHAILIAATDNEKLITISRSIMTGVAWTTLFMQRDSGLPRDPMPAPRDPMPEHWALYHAVAQGKAAKASKAMAELIRLAHQDTQISMTA